VESTVKLSRTYTSDTIFLDIKKDARAWTIVEPLLDGTMFSGGERSEIEAAASRSELAAMLDLCRCAPPGVRSDTGRDQWSD
jgi:hypothetical protein